MTLSREGRELEIGAGDPSAPHSAFLLEELLREMYLQYPKQFVHGFDPAEVADGKGVFLVAKLDGKPVGCGALRRLEPGVGEIKRMYVQPSVRRRGVARRILERLEEAARGFRFRMVRLEAGTRQPEALAFYEATGYRRTAAFGEYVGDPYSVCYEKVLE